jgi:hypothetical protein
MCSHASNPIPIKRNLPKIFLLFRRFMKSHKILFEACINILATMMNNENKANHQVQVDSLLGLALSDADNLGIFNFFAPSELPHVKSSDPVDVEAITLQVLSELDDSFPEFDYSDMLDAEGFEPIPILIPNMCSSSVPNVCSSSFPVDKKRGLDGNKAQAEQPSKKQRCVSPSEVSFEDPNSSRFRDYQAEQWTEKFEELCAFVKKNGHCQVPHGYPENQSLARWTKRQRYQYKLKSEGKPSTMTDDRIAALNALGFVWNSHGAVWEERLNEIKEYKRQNGHCNVPSQYDENQKLATWVKCQRRQYKLFVASKRSNMTVERVNRLQGMGFVWEIRCHTPK